MTDRPALETEIEITAEMIEAGVEAIDQWLDKWSALDTGWAGWDHASLARAVCLSMLSKTPAEFRNAANSSH